MKQRVISVQQDSTIEMAAAIIREHHIGTLPVVDLQKKLVGMLRLENLLALVMPDFVHLVEHFEFAHNFGSLEYTKPDPSALKGAVKDIMEDPISVLVDSGVLRAAALLHLRDLRDLPVVDAENTLVGLVSHVDLGVALMTGWELPELSADTGL
jgi:CBS-domain-containing membrane protein